MERYIGLDVHAMSCTLAVMGPTGKRISWEVVATNGEALVDAVKKVRGSVWLCMEEGTQSAWLYEILSPLVAGVVVVGLNERRRRGNKNDTEDAFELAEMLRVRGDELRRVYKKVGRFKTLRALVKGYGFLTGDVVRSKNRLKAAYRSEGVPTTGTQVYSKDSKEEWLPKLPTEHHGAVGVLHDTFAALEGLKTGAEHAMVAEAKKHSAFELLQTVPGFGPIRSAQMLSVVVTPHRFRTKRQLWAYSGLGIVTNSSSDWVRGEGRWIRKAVQQTRGLNKNHNHVMKNVFKGAAMTVVQKHPSTPLHADYERLVGKGVKPNLALLTITRKIAAIALAVWKSGKPYDPAHGTTNTKESIVDDKVPKE